MIRRDIETLEIVAISMENPCIDRALLVRQGKLISRNSSDRYGLRQK